MISRVVLFELSHQNSMRLNANITKKFSRRLEEMMSKGRNLLFCLKLVPYSKLNPAGKLRIPQHRQQPRAFVGPPLHSPFSSGTGLPPCASPPIWQDENGSSLLVLLRIRKTWYWLRKKRRGIWLITMNSPHFRKTAQLLGHTWSTGGAVQSPGRIPCMPNCRFHTTPLR